jgi:hypothetical protein
LIFVPKIANHVGVICVQTLVTCGGFDEDGTFLVVPEFDEDRMLALWEDCIFKLLIKEGLITDEVEEQMHSWDHTGFGFDQSVYLPAGDHKGIERLVQYMVRCPFSLPWVARCSRTPQQFGRLYL